MTEEEKPQGQEQDETPESDPGPPIVELIGESDPGPASMDAIAGSGHREDQRRD